MCELNVMVVTDGKKEMFMESVTRIIVDDDSIELTGIFGDKKSVTGHIREINFSTGETIIIKK